MEIDEQLARVRATGVSSGASALGMRRPGDPSPLKAVSVTATSRYYVKVDGVTVAAFSEISGMQLETELFEYQEGGNNSFVYKMPTVTKAGNVTLKRGIAKDKDLLKWYLRVASGIMDLREVTITMTATNINEVVMTWTLINAFPCKWIGPQLAAGTDAVAIETIELAHMGEIKIG